LQGTDKNIIDDTSSKIKFVITSVLGTTEMVWNITRINRKSEAQNSKLETNPNTKCSNVQNCRSSLESVSYFDIRISNLFSVRKNEV